MVKTTISKLNCFSFAQVYVFFLFLFFLFNLFTLEIQSNIKIFLHFFRTMLEGFGEEKKDLCRTLMMASENYLPILFNQENFFASWQLIQGPTMFTKFQDFLQ